MWRTGSRTAGTGFAAAIFPSFSDFCGLSALQAGETQHESVTHRETQKPVEWWVQGSLRTPHASPPQCRSIHAHLGILRPEGLDSLGHIAIVDVAAVDFEEIAECSRIVAGTLQRRREFVMEGGAGFLIQAGKL